MDRKINKMDDLINKQMAIDALKQQAEIMSEWSNRYAEQRKGVLTAVNIVGDLPSAEPERKRGKWHIDAEGNVRCTACKTKCLRDDIGINILSKYCPSCGMKMSG